MPELPSRDDAIVEWLRRWRDRYDDDTKRFNDFGSPYWLLDSMLDDYRLHADTGTPLDQHACEGPNCCADR